MRCSLRQFFAACLLTALAATLAGAAPPIEWSQPFVASAIGDGQGVLEPTTLSFTSSKSLRHATIFVTPELEPYVSVSPSDLGSVPAHTAVEITLEFKLPPHAVPSIVDGTLHVRDGMRTIPRPLPVTLTIDFGNNLLGDRTRVLTEATTQELLSISADGSVYVFESKTTELAELSPGDVLVFPIAPVLPDGSLRLVLDAYYDGQNFVVVTEAASLTDALQSASIDASLTLLPDEVSQASFLMGVRSSDTAAVGADSLFSLEIDAVLFDLDGDLTTDDDQVRAFGSLAFETRFDFEFDASFFEVDRVLFTNTTTETSSLDIFGDVQVLEVSESVELANYNFRPFVIQAGPMPIVVRPELSVSVNLDGSVNVSLHAGASQQAELTLGVLYEDGTWAPITEFDNNYAFDTPTASLNAFFRGSAGPTLTLRIYGVLGPNATALGFVEFDVDTTRCPNWWQLWAGLEVAAGIDFGPLSRLIADISYSTDLIREILAAAEECPGGGGTILIDENFDDGQVPAGWQVLQGGAIVSDGGSSPALLLTSFSRSCIQLPGTFTRADGDLVIEADVRITSSSVGDFDITALFNGLDLGCDPQPDGYRLFAVPAGSDSDPSRLFSVNDGVYSILAEVPGLVAGNQWFRIRLALGSDGTIAVEVNGEEIFEVSDSSHVSGPIVLESWRPVWIDNVRVSLLE